MATCPKCRFRFRFRDPLEDVPVDASSEYQVQTTDDHQTQPNTPPMLVVHEEDDPLPPGAQVGLGTPQSVEQTVSEIPEQEKQNHQHNTPQTEKTPSNVLSENKKNTFLTNKPQRIQTIDVPWERPEKYGTVGGFIQTIQGVLFTPSRFFVNLPGCKDGLTRPVLFYIILGVYETLLKIFWMQDLVSSMDDSNLQAVFSSVGNSLAMTLLLTPGLLFMQMFVYAALFFLMLRLVQPEKVVFTTVVRIVAYSAAPLVFSLIPGVGPLMASLWFAVCSFIGCRYALDMPWHKVALALIPLYMIGFAANIQFISLFLAG